MFLDMKTIKVLQEGGITFFGQLPEPWGGCTISLEEQEIIAFLKDKIQFAADKNGVFKYQYLDWLETMGTPRCGATTKSGARCKNDISGGIQHNLDDWLQLDGGFCTVHGGKNSKQAKLDRRDK